MTYLYTRHSSKLGGQYEEISFFLLFLLFILMLTGCNYVEEKKAENIIQNYYQAIKDEDYEEAFKQLHL